MCAFTTADFAPESDTSRSFCRADCVSTLMFAPDSSRICFTVAPALPMIPPTWLFDSMILSVCVCAGVTPSAVAAVAPAALSSALDCSSSTSSMSPAALLSPRGEPVTLISRSVAPCKLADGNLGARLLANALDVDATLPDDRALRREAVIRVGESPRSWPQGRSRLQRGGRWGVARLTAAEFVIHMRTVTDSDGASSSEPSDVGDSMVHASSSDSRSEPQARVTREGRPRKLGLLAESLIHRPA